MEISSEKWLIACKGGGSMQFDIAGKVKQYGGQWECCFFIIKREKMAKLEWEEGNKGRELVLNVHM